MSFASKREVAKSLFHTQLPVALQRRRERQRLAAFERRLQREVPFYRDRDLCAPTEATEWRQAPVEARLSSGTPSQPARSDWTSGSSGAPRAQIWLDALDAAEADAVWTRSYRAMGLPLWGRRVRLRIPDPRTALPSQLAWRSRLGLPGPLEIASTLPVSEQLERLKRLRPQVLHGAPHEVVALAEAVRATGKPLTFLKLIVVGGQALHAPDALRIERWLGQRPRRVYGATELGFVAWECARGNYHLNADHVAVEWTHDGQDGRPNVLFSSLGRRAMPVLRYRIGDVILRPPSPRCDCGHPLPRLGRVLGPASGFIKLPTQGVVTEHQIAEALGELGPLHAFALRQRRRELVEMSVYEPATCAIQTLHAALSPLLGQVELRVDHAPRPQSDSPDKHPLVHSSVLP